MGVKTVIDLRLAEDGAPQEKRLVEAAGMRFINIPMHGMQTPNSADVEKALALFSDPSAGPVFIHCKRGADRTGTVVACYRISHDHWDNQKALSEAKGFGMSWMQRAMHHYVLAYHPAAPQQVASSAVGAAN